MKNVITVFVLILGVNLSHSLTRQSLNGQWSVSGTYDDTVIADLSATVPGGIFSDLMDQEQIADVFYGTGDSNYRWVGLTDWTYTTTFTVDEELLSYRVVSLVFEGLDTFATILINGNEVGTSQNMFVRYVFSIKNQLQVGVNEISVQFASPVNRAAALAQNPNNSYVIPPECHPSDFNGICYVNRIRKMQASFSWDWGPAFASVGIWKDVYLQAFDNAVIDYLLATPSLNEDGDIWTLTISTFINGVEIAAIGGGIQINLETENGTQSFNTAVTQNTKVFEMSITSRMEVPVSTVNTWWPNGYGNQDLYNLTVAFVGDTEQDEKTVRVGFRTIELVQEELGEGLSFYFKVNGIPIFAKGANEIPVNILPEKGQEAETVRNILETAKETHMNMLRVWGGGVYESNYFYDLADEYGILIWQDFMFACAMYPTDEAYLSNVVQEVRHQIRRLGSHPSIAIWAGNNENEAALAQNWYNTSDNYDSYKSDYVTLYIDTIQYQILRTVGGWADLTFTGSSPTNGLASNLADYVAENPSDPLYGDVHFYDYTQDSWDVSTFPIPRFASEYGYQSMPSIESWLTVTDSVDDLNPDSDFLIYRQHHPDGNQQNLDLINIQLQLPDSSSDNYVQAFIYFSQIVQAQSVKTETEHYRSFKGRVDKSGQGNTMGALYWQLNDVWVAPTWSGMDYTGRWKMLQYYTKDFFSPMIITGRLITDNLEVYAILDGIEVTDSTVRAVVRVYRWDLLDALLAVEFPVTLDPLASVLVTTIDAPTALTTAGCGSNYTEAKTNCFFHLHLMDEDNNDLAPSNYVFPEKLKNSNLTNSHLEISSLTSVDEDGRVFDIVVATDAISLFVWLDSHNVQGRFSENGFLLVAPTKTVTFTADESVTVEGLEASLTVTHLRDPLYL